MSEREAKEKVSFLIKQITQAEELRVAAIVDDGHFDDAKLQQAIEISRQALATVGPVEEADLKSWPNRKLAAVAHLWDMVATVEQTRVSHTLENATEKKEALQRAQEALLAWEKLAAELERRRYYWTADGTPFIWPVELARVRARNWERQPEASRDDLEKALASYQKARDLALELSKDQSLDAEIRRAALMAAGTARVEAVLVADRLGELNQDEVQSQFAQAQQELFSAWDEGYHETDRLRASCLRMVKLIEDKYPHLVELTDQIKADFQKRTGKELK